MPTDQVPFLRLTASVAALWPDHPPYEAAHDELIAHLTLIETADARARDKASAAATETGPFAVKVGAMTVIPRTPRTTGTRDGDCRSASRSSTQRHRLDCAHD